LRSGDGKRVVTASRNNTARIWGGEETAVLKGHGGPVTHERRDVLRERVYAEKLIGAAQEFSESEMEDPICAASTRTIRLPAIRACAGRCRPTIGPGFRASSGVRREGSWV
jgi:hypothetical protein